MMWIDYLIIAIIVYFAIMGILAGFIKYFFSLAGLIVGLLFANKLISVIHPWVVPFLQKFIDHPKIIFIICWIIAFLLIYISFILIGNLINRLISLSGFKFLDRLLGGVFGFIKAWILIVAVYYLATLFIPSIKHQIKHSYSYPYIEKSVQIAKELFSLEKLKSAFSGKDFFFNRQ